MSTTYYVKLPLCEQCNRRDEDISIGTRFGSYLFALNVTSKVGPKSLKEWLNYLKGKEIIDEYDRPVTQDEFKEVVASCQGNLAREDGVPDGPILTDQHFDEGWQPVSDRWLA